jgi:hypothetical protein
MNRIVKTILVVLLLLYNLELAGCQKESIAKVQFNNISSMSKIDPNNCNEFKGEAANIITKQIASNMANKQSMLSDVFKKSGLLFAGLTVTMVGGLIFWGFTGSRFGWVIPASCIGGIFTILMFVNYSKWIFAIVLGVSGLFLIWKAVEYHTERDAERAKLGK